MAALADLHFRRNAQGTLQPLLSRLAEAADVVLLCGNLIDYGLPEEAHGLVKELAPLKRPLLAVLGNHEYEADQVAEVARIFADAGIMLLDGDACEVAGIGFAGVKGFGGGFGRGALQPWGEETIKRFVHEAVGEALKLESALAKLRTPHRIALLHYAPIRGTTEGEPPEILPFLGSSRLEEPLNRYPVTAVFHGHAHRGASEGRTSAGTPVYNVALPLLQQTTPERPFRVLQVPATAPPAPPPAPRRFQMAPAPCKARTGSVSPGWAADT